MNTAQLTSEEIAQLLHAVFDEQIINYGAYNLVLASGKSHYENSDIANTQQENQHCFLIGYRDAPQEVIITPVALPGITSAGAPTSIDNTNVVALGMDNEGQLIVETTNGTVFSLSFRPLHSFTSSYGQGILDQTLDLEDFTQFLGGSTLLEQI